MDHIGAQAPKADLALAAPPAVVGDAATALAAFTREVDPLGRNEFEPAGSVPAALNFDYAGGAGRASFNLQSPSSLVLPIIKAGADANPQLGRYNMSPAVAPAPDGSVPGRGNWLEASSGFDITFSQAISAFSFFATDLGDYDGHFFLDLFDAAGRLVFSQELRNQVQGEQRDSPTSSRITGNGNLLFVGITSSNPTETFSRAAFRISQCTPFDAQNPNAPYDDGCDGNTDIIGFDSFVVGNYRAPTGGTQVPEPTSLALVGLGLLAAGCSRKAQRTA